MNKIQEIKLYIKRFSQVIQIEPDDKGISVLEAFVEKTELQIQSLWEDFIICKKLVEELVADADEQELEMLNVINTLFGCYEEISACIINRLDVEEIVRVIDIVYTIMLFLQPLVIKKSNERKRDVK